MEWWVRPDPLPITNIKTQSQPGIPPGAIVSFTIVGWPANFCAQNSTLEMCLKLDLVGKTFAPIPKICMLETTICYGNSHVINY